MTRPDQIGPVDYDVIVIGSGIAGHCAALEAVDAGARVLMLEAEKRIGGSSRLSTGVVMGADTRFQREQGVLDDSPEEFFQTYMTANQYQVQPSVARRLCYDAGPTVDWLEARGVNYLALMDSGERRPRGHITEGGEAIIQSLNGRLGGYEKIDVALDTRVDHLLWEGGVVRGVAAAGAKVTANSVVLATGGMGANLDLVARWQETAFDEGAGAPFYIGSDGARGDAIRFGEQVEAQILKGRGVCSPIWRFGGGYLPAYMLIVNALGRRFIDESIAYGPAEAIFAAQPGATGHVIFDEASRRAMTTAEDVAREVKFVLPGMEHVLPAFTAAGVEALVAQGLIHQAETLEQLARVTGAPLRNLAGTLERYNGFATAGEDQDYLKPGRLRPVAAPPFYTFQMNMRGFALTTSGLRIDHDAHVLGRDSRPIEGLYAAGECTGGVIVRTYVGSGNGLASASTFGRVAGRSAARRALSVCRDAAPLHPRDHG